MRVIRYRQHHADGTVVEAQWLTDLSKCKAPSPSLFRMARSRWEIENQGFNDCNPARDWGTSVTTPTAC